MDKLFNSNFFEFNSNDFKLTEEEIEEIFEYFKADIKEDNNFKNK